MILRARMTVALIVLAAGFTVAATQKSAVDGRWKGTVSTPNGDFTMTYTFKAKGQVLTGTVETEMGSQPITDGKVNGDKISFKTSYNGNPIDHQGTVSGDTIQLKDTGPFGEFDLTLKRLPGVKKSE